MSELIEKVIKVGMNEDKFNRYCAEVMGYKEVEPPKLNTGSYYPIGIYVSNDGSGRWNFNPWDDLNKTSEVLHQLLVDVEHDNFPSVNEMYELGIKKAFRDFIISTMPDEYK